MRGIPWRLLAAGALTAFLLDLPFPIAGPLPIWRTIFAWFALVPLLVAVLRLPEKAEERSRRWQLGWSLLAGWLCGGDLVRFELLLGATTPCTSMAVGMNALSGGKLSLVMFSLYLGFWFGVIRC